MKILVLNLAKNTTNLKKLIILPSKKFEITTQHQFQILCEQLPLIPGKSFLCKVEIHYTQEELK